MGLDNQILQKSKDKKDDEFYTLIGDIEAELQYYDFTDKHVLLPCDCPTFSEFFRYFYERFQELGLRRLTAVYFEDTETSTRTEVTLNEHGNTEVKQYPMSGNGDFRNEETKQLMRECDVVVTNPPFSLFRTFFAQLTSVGAKFITVCTHNVITYKDVFPYVRDRKVWAGHNYRNMKFMRPHGGIKKRGDCMWLTNYGEPFAREPLELKCTYSPEKYPEYDNFKAIEVKCFRDIPKGYYGVMGVPVTYAAYYNPEQFILLGTSTTWDNHPNTLALLKDGERLQDAILNDKHLFKRLFIKRTNKK